MRNLPYNRTDRVGKQIYQIIASYIYENIDDTRFIGIQFTEVKLTKDFSLARVYYYIEGGKEKQDACKQALEEKKGEIRHYVGSELTLRSLPKLEFLLDEGVKKSERISELLDQLKT